ncbi:MAG: glycosyltransferase [Pseudomarimonas sp.]
MTALSKLVDRARRVLRRPLRLKALAVCMAVGEWWIRHVQRAPAKAPSPLAWAPGLSVIIPERGGGELLRQCLAGLGAALNGIEEPCEIIVVVNGSPRDEYAEIIAAWPHVRWRFFDEPLGFTGAVLQGLALVRYGAVYLLNNDMQLEPDALRQVLAWRGPAVFGIATQLLFPDDGRRREETGWTFMPVSEGLPRPWHAESVHDVVRGCVWAGAGAALFHTETLRRLMPGCLPYDPFYWEDVDLGLRAWQEGYESLYCPASKALHLHRVTVRRYNTDSEVERIFERNSVQLALRHCLAPTAQLLTGSLLSLLPTRSIGELGSWRACVSLWRARMLAASQPFHALSFQQRPLASYRRIPRAPVIWVTPFVVLPPRHGGALRTQRLAAELARDHHIVLLNDEAALYGEPDSPDYAPFAAVHLVDGRPPLAASQQGDRLARMHAHAHTQMRLELLRLIGLHRPDVVVIEHMELAGLVELDVHPRPRFLLNLPDVLLQPDDPAQSEADRREQALMDRYDAIVVSSAEDQSLLTPRTSTLVANGCDVQDFATYLPSTGHRLLFVGPFRAAINWEGIRAFVRDVYPVIRAAVPEVCLTIVGGVGASARAESEPGFADPSISVLETVPSVAPLLAAAALSINPQLDLRGSSLKVLESIAHGRVCVTTSAAARGHNGAGFNGLVVVESLADFAPAIIDLLCDQTQRQRLEVADHERLAPWAWPRCAEPLRELVGRLKRKDLGSANSR